MTILVLSNYGMGLYKFRKELLETLCKDHRVILALPDSEFTEKLKDIGCEFMSFEFDRRGINPLADMRQITGYRNLIKHIRPDAVLTYTIKPNVYGGIACRLTKTPYIANVTGLGTAIENGGLLGWISTTLYKVGLKKAACVFFQNQNNYDTFVKGGIYKGTAALLPGSGVNLEYHAAAAYPPADEVVRFLFVGRIMKDKGIGELLEAIRTVHAQYENVSLDIVGGCDEDYLAALSKEDIQGYVRYHGSQPDVRPFIHTAHCTVLPSYHEGMANVLLESASACRPVIATRVPGCAETYDDGVTGLGCDVRDAKSLADAMIRFVKLPQPEKEKMGLLGRQKMQREYDRQLVINAYCNEIDNLSKGKTEE